MDARHVDPRTLAIWRWQAALFAVMPSIPLVVATLRTQSAFAAGSVVLYLVAAWVCVWTLPRAYYRALQFAVDEHGITISRGILWRSQTLLPRVRVQHSDVSQGPMQRRYGVATLKLYTAGSRYTKIELPGLEHQEAVALRDALLARGGDSGV